ncbi:MAG: 2-polyprenyl-6-methoxyphenol hydroxylase [Cyclobacteriaceae bacterium]|nr:2-polyprenyl-6-methoxyphenol hydroxylase [Cyclobacteriaceae bacterium]
MSHISVPVILVIHLCSSCTHDNLEEYYGLEECDPAEVAFNSDIKPVFTAKCAISPCHIEGTGLPAFTDYEKIAAQAEMIRFQTSSGSMPPASSGLVLTVEEVRKIACWIDAGAQDN